MTLLGAVSIEEILAFVCRVDPKRYILFGDTYVCADDPRITVKVVFTDDEIHTSYDRQFIDRCPANNPKMGGRLATRQEIHILWCGQQIHFQAALFLDERATMPWPNHVEGTGWCITSFQYDLANIVNDTYTLDTTMRHAGIFVHDGHNRSAVVSEEQ